MFIILVRGCTFGVEEVEEDVEEVEPQKNWGFAKNSGVVDGGEPDWEGWTE